jgi:cation:H+ antiporter
MRSDSSKQRVFAPVCALLILAVMPIRVLPPSAVLWTGPSILLAAMLIAWAAESAQFFVAQGFALAILAWLQTLPEFAVEAVLSWKQQVSLLLAGLTGALRLLTGLGWPMIYFTASFMHRMRTGRRLHRIILEKEHSVEVVGLLACMAYAAVIWWKATLDLWDAAILIGIYVAYLAVLRHIPPEEAEGIEDLELIPRTIVKSPRPVRITLIVALFLVGGALIYLMAEPFLGSLLALSTALGVPSFVFIQWVAPFVSEFPEKVSAFYWARTVDRASMALMNMVSSNINQWTLLVAMLAVVFSASRGAPAAIAFDSQQELELLMTLGQSLIGALFLINMELAWWEAAALFLLWLVQFALSPIPPSAGLWGTMAGHVHKYVTYSYLIWAAVEVGRMVIGWRKPAAFQQFAEIWRRHVRNPRPTR